MSNLFRNGIVDKNKLTLNEIVKLEEIRTKSKVKCKCGHTLIIPSKHNKTICTWCGEYVFRNKEDEFKYRLNELAK